MNRARMPQVGITPTGSGELNRTFAVLVSALYNKRRILLEVKLVADEFKFETFVEAQGTAMQEYLSGVVARLSKTDKAYRAIQDEIEKIYKEFPKVIGVFDIERAAALTEQECAAVIKVAGLQNQLVEMELQSVYFRGCYDSVGYLKKAGIL